MCSPSSLVNTYLSSPRIANFTVFSTLISSFPSYYQDKYILATPLLGFNAWWTVINFLALLSICSNSAFVQSTISGQYSSYEITHVFIHAIVFLPFTFVSSNFLFFIFNTTHFATRNSITMSLLNARPGWINYSSNFSLPQVIHKK